VETTLVHRSPQGQEEKDMKVHLMWFVHNMIAHPLSEIVHLIGFLVPGKSLEKLSVWIHKVTVPNDQSEAGQE